MLTKVKHKIESGLVPAVLPADLDKVDNVLVVEQLQDSDFPKSSDGESFFFIFHQHFLQRYNFTPVCSTSCLKRKI